MTLPNHEDILKFWFEEIEEKAWFKKDLEFDQLLISRFGELHTCAEQAELYQWRSTIEGRLAEIIVLDQFSRNMYRDTPRSFASDPMSLTLAQEAVSQKLDDALTAKQQAFLYMPYMHSESKIIHEVAVTLFAKTGQDSNIDYEQRHKIIIDQYGRYPHRNKILGRESTAAEIEFLSGPGSSF